MSEHRPEVADVFRDYGTAFLEVYGRSTSADQRRVLRDLTVCRTATLGGHKNRCDRCAHEQVSYNSCRNRHCPKCQGAARRHWLKARESELLDLPYFHVVFSVPDTVGPLALQNKRLVYGILFRAVSETLHTLAADRRHLGARIGFLAVLHTWGQNLHHHPHVHCVVPAGGIGTQGDRWVACREGFFLPVRVLSRLFRGKFLAFLHEAFRSGKLHFYGKQQRLQEPENWTRWRSQQQRKEWVVYAKPPFGGPAQVLRYLARYTHRVAISNHRLLSVRDGKVTFRWKDYAQKHRQRTLTLPAEEFIRRFLLHVLPTGFMRIRHYGFLANRVRQKRLLQIRKLLSDGGETHVSGTETPDGSLPQPTLENDPLPCPACKKGRLQRVAILPPADSFPDPAFWFDTS